jgi:hypothetical protein
MVPYVVPFFQRADCQLSQLGIVQIAADNEECGLVSGCGQQIQYAGRAGKRTVIKGQEESASFGRHLTHTPFGPVEQ